LVNHYLAGRQRGLGNPVPGLDQRRGSGLFSGRHAGGAPEKPADVDCIGGVVGTLVDHLQHVGAADDGGRDLDAAGAPAVRQRHFPSAERYLVTGDGDRFQDRPSDHALGLFVEVGEVVAFFRIGRGGAVGAIRLDVIRVAAFSVRARGRGAHQAASRVDAPMASSRPATAAAGPGSAACCSLARARAARRKLRTSASSDWKST
jgi:hypothetical protein